MTIIRVEYEGTRYDLDVLESTPIRLDISAIENNDIGEIFGASSQTFTLPGSKKNNQFFKHAYKVGTEVVPGLNDSVKCWIINNSDTLLEGSLYLDSVVKTANEGVNYEVTIVNNVITFNETIKTTRVKDLKWSVASKTNPTGSGFDHSFSALNVSSSWNGDIFGAIYYPLIDQGRDGNETTGSLPNVAIGTGVGFINSPITPLKVNQLTPAVKIKTLLDLIFEQGEFTYETSLTDLFNQTYILPKQTEDLSVKGSDFSGFGFISTNTSDQIIAASTSWTTIQFNSESLDENGDYNTSTYTYTTPVAGTYGFSGSINYAIDPEDTNASLQVRLRNTTDNFTLSSVTFNPTTLTGSFDIQTNDINVAQFKDLQLQFRYLQGTGEGLLDATVEVGSAFFTTKTPINWETGIIKMGEQFDPQLKCIDIIRGISQKFNLVFEPDYTKNRVIKIETYKEWVSTGNRKDWTQKIQQAERIFLKSPLSSQPKTLEFQDAKDNDKLSKKVIDNAEGLQWGTAIVDAISDVPQGEKKVGEYFAPIVLEQIPGAATNRTSNVYPYIPQLYKTDDTQVDRKTFKFKPRIGYKVNSNLPEECYIGNNVTPFSSYATISNYNALPVVSGSTKNLHWNDTFYPPTFTDTTGSVTAYDEYWSNYVNDLYRDDNKILRADIYFEPYELNDIKLNDAIFVEDSYYRINKISGYNVNNPDLVSVELIGLSSGELPSVDINCNFDFEWGLTTSTTTLIPPVQPTTSTTTAAPLSASVTITDASNETCNNGSLNFAINGGYTPYTLNVNSTSYGGGTNSSWNVLVSNLEDGIYPWTITDNVGTTISGSETIICTYVPPTTTTTTTSTTTTTTLPPQSYQIKQIYSGSTQPFTGSVDLYNETYEFVSSTPQKINYGSVTGGLDIVFTTQSADLFNLYKFAAGIENMSVSVGSIPYDTHYARFKFNQNNKTTQTRDSLIDINGNAENELIIDNIYPIGLSLESITSSFEYVPIPSKQIEMTIILDPALFGSVNFESASLYYRKDDVNSRVKILEHTGSLSSGSYTFKTNTLLPTLQNYSGNYALEIELKAPTGQTFKFNESPNNRIYWKRNGSTVETDTFSSTTLYSSASAGSFSSAATSAFTNWGPASSFATYSVEVDSLTDAVIYYEGFACEYPFANSDLIAASSSLSTGQVVRVGFPGGDACYTILRETTKKEYTFLVEDVFGDCATCSGSL